MKQQHLHDAQVATSSLFAAPQPERPQSVAPVAPVSVAPAAHAPALTDPALDRRPRGRRRCLATSPNGHGFGVLQVDDRSHRPDRSEGAYGQAHINQAAAIFDHGLDAVKRDFPGLSPEAQLQTAVSRYNGGSGRVHPNSDRGTTHGDYGNDTLARAQYFAGHWTKP